MINYSSTQSVESHKKEKPVSELKWKI